MTIGPSSAVCAVCSKPKASLRKRKSKLIVGNTMLVCDSCYAGKKEPRWAIILVARKDRNDPRVAELVKNRRYVGDDIKFEDLI